MIHDGAEEDKEVLMKFHWEEDESFKILVKEIEEGNVGAMYRIWMIHLFGLRGLRVDHAKALSWSSKAADKGDPRQCISLHLYAAYNRMGYLYLNSDGVDQDYIKAIEYFEKSTENSGAGRHYNLGLMYLRGLGAPVLLFGYFLAHWLGMPG
ncbi:hypothetical protein QYF36_014453 [Acer negundo]|nr:hypothetical protein QYF36_014453 [Acer negundo]